MGDSGESDAGQTLIVLLSVLVILGVLVFITVWGVQGNELPIFRSFGKYKHVNIYYYLFINLPHILLVLFFFYHACMQKLIKGGCDRMLQEVHIIIGTRKPNVVYKL